ncbi:MAG: hypothetical protein ABIN91_20010 [Mucilaginibacter sp.]|uniref:hypothetical protein n=1 Tax=Mucilaginibacter sp. TaxID=1882438 RepID=UPI00326584C6
MKNPVFALVIVLCTIFCSCEPKRGEYKIYPLSPFSTQVDLGEGGDLDKDIQTNIKTQYYLVDEDVDLTDKTKVRLQDFIKEKLGADINNNKAIYFTFYKGTFTFSRNSVQTKEELEANHADQKLAEFEYKDGKLYNFDFFKNGTYYEQPAER